MRAAIFTLVLGLFFTVSSAQDCDIATTGVTIVTAGNIPISNICVGQKAYFKFSIFNSGSDENCIIPANSIEATFDFPTLAFGIKPYTYTGPLSFNSGHFTWTYNSTDEVLEVTNNTAIPNGAGDVILIEVTGNGTFPNPVITGSSAGISALNITQDLGISDNTANNNGSAQLTVYAAPTVTNQLDQAHCNISTFTMMQTAPAFGTGAWSLVAGTATITTASSPTTTITGVAAGASATVRWTVTNGSCSIYDDVILQNDIQPTVSNQPNQAQCNNSSFTMTQTSPSPGTGLWTLQGGSATITNPSSPTTTITGVTAGTTATIRWTVTNGTCTAFDDVVVQNDIQPIVSDQSNQIQCNTSIFTMTQTAPLAGTGVWTLLGGSATITNPSSPTTTITGVTAGTSATVRWTVTNGTCTAFDDVIVQNDLQPIVSNQANQNQCNNSIFTMTQAAPSVGTGVWTLLGGSAAITNPSSPTTTITGVTAGTAATIRWTVTNGTCTAFDDVVVQNDIQPIVSDQPNQIQCNTSIFTMTQTAPSVGTGVWTLVSGTATITTPSLATTTVTGVTAGATATVRWTVTNGTCTAFDDVVVQNDLQPVVSNQPNQTQCDNSIFTMTQTAPSVGTGVWTLQSGSATIINPSSPTTTVTGIAAGTTAIVRWTVTNGTCGAFDDVVVQNDIQPIVSDQPNQTQCNTSTFTMTQTAPSAGTGAWTFVGAPGAATITNASSPTTTVTGVAAGATATIRWTVTNGTCTAFDDVIVQNNIQPIVTNQPNQTQCDNSSFAMTQTAPSVGTGVWTLQSGSATITNSSSPTTTVTGVTAGTAATVRWTVTNGTCTAFDDVVVQSDIQPIVSDQPNQTQCNTSTFTMTQTAPSAGTGIWTFVGASGVAVITTPSSPTTTVTGVTAGTVVTVRWTVSNGTCSAFDDVIVQNDLQPTVSNQPNQSQCDNSTFTMTQTAPSVGTGLWTLQSGSATITNSSSPTTTVTGVTTGTTATVRWTVTNGTCTAFDDVIVQNDIQPVVSDQPNQSQCNTSTFTMTQTAPSAGTGIWTFVGASGVAVITTPSSPTTTVTGVTAGTVVTVRWTVSNGTCSAFDDVIVQNDLQPTVSNQPNQSQCDNSTFTMTQTAPSVGTGLWTLQSGSATITNSSSPTTTVTGVTTGTTATVRWTVTNGTCTAFDDVIVQNDIQPVVSDQPNQSQCNTSTFTMTQTAPSAGTGIWTFVGASGVAVITTPSSPTTTVTGVTAGTVVTVRWTVSNGTCSAFDDVIVQNDLQPTVSNQPNQSQCDNSTFTMTQTAPSVGTGLWTLQSGSATITNPSSPTTTVTGVTTGTTATVKWTVTNGTCTAFDDVDVTNNALPVVTWTNTLADQCISSTTYTLTGGSPAGGVYSGAGVTGSNFNANAAGAGTYTLTYIYTNLNGCVNTATNTITVQADNLNPNFAFCPSPITVASPNSPSCLYTTTLTDPAVSDNCTPSNLIGLTWTLTGPGAVAPLSGTGPIGSHSFGMGLTNITYTATDASGNSSTCFFTVNVSSTLAASISGTTTVPPGPGSSNITFTGSGGSMPYTFTYKINGGSYLVVTTTNPSSTVNVAQSNAVVGTFVYTLVSVTDANGCTVNLPANTTATITVSNTRPDLTSAVTKPGNSQFINGQVKEGNVTITNASANPTTGIITFRISLVQNFDLEILGTTTTSAGDAVNNTDWTITAGPLFYTITSKVTAPPINGGTLPSGPFAAIRIGFKLTATGFANSSGLMTVTIINDTGGASSGSGDSNNNNNQSVKLFTIN